MNRTTVNQYKTVIVDDEILAIKNLRLGLDEHPLIDVVAEATNKEEARTTIEQLKPDLVFLDINLVSATGFDLLDELEYKEFQLVFVTAHNDYALKAFEYAAQNYILKPLRMEALSRTIDKLRPKPEAIDTNTLAELSRMIQRQEDAKTSKLALTTPRGVVLRPVDEVVSLKSSGNYCFVYFSDESKVIVSRTMKEMEAQLSYYNFFRIHHSILVNCDKVKMYQHKEGYVELTNGESFSVSFRRRSAFLKYIKQLEQKL